MSHLHRPQPALRRALEIPAKGVEHISAQIRLLTKQLQQRFPVGLIPVTLYKEQWLRILASAADIEAFIRENDSKLKAKE